jgi:hypothetical protein
LDLVPGLRDFLAHFKHKGDRSQGVQELSRVEKHRLAAVYHSLLEKVFIVNLYSEGEDTDFGRLRIASNFLGIP